MDLDAFVTCAGLKGLRKHGHGYLALCPAHEDHRPSLSIGEAQDGRILLHCWAGCETRDVVAAVGLSLSDLFPPRGSRHRRRSR